MKKNTKIKKLTDEQFLSILRANMGLFSRTARAIKMQHNIEYSRQAVRERALKHKEIYDDIIEEGIDVGEENLHSLMRSKNENMKFKSTVFFLRMKGKDRGYTDRLDLNVHNEELEEISIVPQSKESIEKYKDLMRVLKNDN